MAGTSSIEWTEATWNPVTGCRKVSAGCKNCYAERMAHRLKRMGSTRYAQAFEPTLHEDLIERPFRWKKPRVIFVNSMSDLFQDEVPVDFIQRVFETIRLTPRHTYQILTKRSGRLAELAPLLSWPENLWMGVSVEGPKVLHRVDDLRAAPAHVRFISAEPLLASLSDIDLTGIHWLIAGGESGPGARPMREEWVTEIRNLCLDAGVAFFFKQWGGVNKHRTGRVLEDRTWDEMPQIASHQPIAAK